MRENLRIFSRIMIVGGTFFERVAQERREERIEMEISGQEVTGSVIKVTVNKKCGKRISVTYWLRIT